jgi:hypothetical protein
MLIIVKNGGYEISKYKILQNIDKICTKFRILAFVNIQNKFKRWIFKISLKGVRYAYKITLGIDEIPANRQFTSILVISDGHR